jgi:hypothetical protein
VARECLQPVECARLLEGRGVELERGVRGEDAGAAAGGFLGGARVRRAVGAEEEPRVRRGRRGEQRLAVALALQERQEIQVRAQAAGEHRATVEQQVLRRQRRGDTRALRAHESDAGDGRHVLEHDAKARMPLHQRHQFALDEDALAVVGIDIAAGRLAMKLQHDVALLHALEHRAAAIERGHAGVGMGRRTGRVALDADHEPACRRAVGLRRVHPFGEVQCHQRLERGPRRQGRQDAFPVAPRGVDGGDRRLEVWHHDGAREGARGERGDGSEFRPVPQVQVPVVRPCHRQCGNRARQGNSILTRGHRRPDHIGPAAGMGVLPRFLHG